MSAAHRLESPESRRIVIVEDEGILALDMERHLRGRGFDVVGVAADSQTALSVVEQTRPDLVLMDIRIQGEVDGIDTARAVAEKFGVPVVYLTAHSDPGTIERAQRTAPLGYLVKPIKKPDLENVVGIALKRARLERSLRERESLLRSTLECLDEAVFTLGDEHAIAFVNPAASTLLGLSAPQLEGRQLTEFFPSACEALTRAEGAGRAQVEAKLDGRAGPRTLIGTAARFEPKSLVVALRDLTELLTARRQAELSERLAALGTLAAGIAHEVNNPLAVVVSNLSFVGSERSLTPDAREALDEAQDAAQRVGRIVSELLVFTGPQEEAPEVTTAAAAVRAALRLTRTQWRPAQVSLVLEDTPPVSIAPTRLSQVLVSLVINAMQAMATAGTSERELKVRVGTSAAGGALVEVVDNGPGVKPELRERIFDPFFTTKPGGKGTGLGLAIARNIVTRLNGTLVCGARADGQPGARFTIELPRSEVPLHLSLEAAWVGPATPLLAELRTTCEVRQVPAMVARSLGAPVVLVAEPLDAAELDRLGLGVLRLPGVSGAGLALERATPRGLLAFAGAPPA